MILCAADGTSKADYEAFVRTENNWWRSCAMPQEIYDKHRFSRNTTVNRLISGCESCRFRRETEFSDAGAPDRYDPSGG
ncbi:MAG: hypothetical protein EON58_20230 [Alphaproteobacteria bacterium]|nr:MAG: hypothetical protein EON58_20230 [Alphaproteobacteria bacterium]